MPASRRSSTEQTGAWGHQGLQRGDQEHRPESDYDPLHRQAGRGERLRPAKVINAEGEFQAAECLRDAARTIATEPGAMQLRYLATLAEISSDRSNTIVFPFPTELRQILDSATARAGSSSGA